MTTLFLYIMAASSDPDNVECVVPYPIDDTEIFFGPCKRLLRKELRDRYLKTSNDVRLEDDVFIVGVNGNNRQRCRKIVWAGRVAHLMTFETAYKKLTHTKYQEMREMDNSPLHVKPLYRDDGTFRGYEHCSSLHGEDDIWVRDFGHNNPHVQKRGKQLLLAPNANRHQAFPRDCCLLLERVFFADGVGIYYR
jgi:hypothetical protein